MTTRLLRWSLIVIAVAAFIDPAVHVAGRGPLRVAIVVEDTARHDEAAAVAAALESALGNDVEIVRGADPSASQTVAIGDRYPAAPLHGRVSTITLPPIAAPRIASIDAPPDVPPATAVHLGIDVVRLKPDATDGAAVTVVVKCGGVEAGRATHAWSGGERQWRAELDVVPVGAPPYVFHAAVDGHDLPAQTADIVVAERRERLRVLVHEARPSWAVAFLRRALESDPRFQVSAVSFPSRGIAVRSGEPPALTSPSLDEVSAVVVGGLDRLGGADASALERFMRERGGAVVLVPDSRRDLELPAVRRLAGDLRPAETLLEQHTALTMRLPLPRVDASEIVTLAPPAGAATIAAMPDGASIVITIPFGAGQLMVSGALDAWRFRADAGVEFDRFWRTLVASAASAAPPAIAVSVAPGIVAAGRTAEVTVRLRSGASIDAIAAADDRQQPIRLWPAPAPGVFVGAFTVPLAAGPHSVSVSLGARAAIGRALFVIGGAHEAEPPPDVPLSLASATRGGIDVGPGEMARLARDLARANEAPALRGTDHPMRSPWWIAPFALCACGDWWLRRRRGLP